MVSAFAAMSAALSGLGAYTAGSWLSSRAIKRRRQIKEVKAVAHDIKAVRDYTKKIIHRITDGIDDEDRAKARVIAAHVRDMIAPEPPRVAE